MTDVASGAGIPQAREETAEDVTPAGDPGADAAPLAADGKEPVAEGTLTRKVKRGRAEAERVREQVAEAVGRAGDAVAKAGDAVERAAAASGRVAATVVDRLRNDAELAVDRGTTRIADEVVEKIAGIAVREVPGVYDIGGDFARILAGLKERVGLGEADEDTDRGMRVRLEGHTAQVNITLVIEYGYVVHSVTERVRTKVISAVENLLGLEVTEVNILVDDVHVPETISGKAD